MRLMTKGKGYAIRVYTDQSNTVKSVSVLKSLRHNGQLGYVTSGGNDIVKLVFLSSYRCGSNFLSV